MVRRRLRCSCVDEKERIGIRKGIRVRERGTIDGSSSVCRAGSKAHKNAKVGVGSNSCLPFGEAKAGGFIRDSRASRKVRSYEVEKWRLIGLAASVLLATQGVGNVNVCAVCVGNKNEES
jgi:hypothetical protein